MQNMAAGKMGVEEGTQEPGGGTRLAILPATDHRQISSRSGDACLHYRLRRGAVHRRQQDSSRDGETAVFLDFGSPFPHAEITSRNFWYLDLAPDCLTSSTWDSCRPCAGSIETTCRMLVGAPGSEHSAIRATASAEQTRCSSPSDEE